MRKIWMAGALCMALALLCPGAVADLWAERGGEAFEAAEAGGSFRFEPDQYARLSAREENFTLMSAAYGDGCTITAEENLWGSLYGYRFEQGGESVHWSTELLQLPGHQENTWDLQALLLADALPQTAEQVRRMNRIASLTPGGMYICVRLEQPGKGTLPVYAAPSADAYRAAGGKAAVSLSGELWVLDWRNGYMMIAYEVSDTLTRVGYVRETRALRSAMERQSIRENDFDSGLPRWGSVQATLCGETVLRDDPVHAGAEGLRTLAAGETVTCLARWGALLAYVRTEVNGREACGFVPLAALDIAEPPEDAEAMARLCGTNWLFEAGGSMYADFQSFREDGVMVASDYFGGELDWIPETADGTAPGAAGAQWWTARYSAAKYDPAWNLFWDDVPYMITYTNTDGSITRYGLRLEDASMSLVTEEGGGGFVPYTGPMDIVPAAQMLATLAPLATLSAQEMAGALPVETMLPSGAEGRVVETGVTSDPREDARMADEETVCFADGQKLPARLDDALAACALGGADVLMGMAQYRYGWSHAQMLLRDAGGYWLCGAQYGQSGWTLTLSRRALRQDEEARIGLWDGYGCDRFEVIYPDTTYRWFCGSRGWWLSDVTRDGVTLNAQTDAISWRGAEEEEQQAVFCDLPIAMEEFDIGAYPTTPQEAAACSEGNPQNDPVRMAVCISPAQRDGSWFSHMACAPMRRTPDASAPVLATFLPGVEGEALEEQNGFVRVRIAEMEGWLPRENVLRGAERAGVFITGGSYAEVYTWGKAEGQAVYDAPREDAQALEVLPDGTFLYRLAFVNGDAWTLVRLADGRTGYMRSEDVSESDNMHEAWIYSEDPTMRLNLREAPDTGSRSLGRYYSGVRVVFLGSSERHEGWARVSIDGTVGWVKTDYLCDWDDYNGREWLPPMGTVQGVNSKGLNLRAEPDGEVIAAYPVGTKAEILGVAGAWAHVRLRDGNTGYMLLSFLGGEPKRAAPNGFALKADVTQTFTTDEEPAVIPSGSRVRVAGRPHAQWYAPRWRDGDDTMEWGEPQTVYVQDGERVFEVDTALLELDW